MRVSVVQMNQGSDKAANMASAEALIAAAVAADRPGLVSLPETWTNLGGGRESRRAAAEMLPAPGAEGGAAYELMRGLARRHRPRKNHPDRGPVDDRLCRSHPPLRGNRPRPVGEGPRRR